MVSIYKCYFYPLNDNSGTFYNFSVSVRTDEGMKRSMSHHVYGTIHKFGPNRDMYLRLEENATGNHHHHDALYKGNLSVGNGVSMPSLSPIEKYAFDGPVRSSLAPLPTETIRLGQALRRNKRKLGYKNGT